MPALQRGAWAEERLLGALWQSVPLNGRVHLPFADVCSVFEGRGRDIPPLSVTPPPVCESCLITPHCLMLPILLALPPDLGAMCYCDASHLLRTFGEKLPCAPSSKFFVFAFFLHLKEKNKQPEHKEFQGLKAPKKGGFRHRILGEIFVFGCLFPGDFLAKRYSY